MSTQTPPNDAPAETADGPDSKYRALADFLEDGFFIVQPIFDEHGDAADFRYVEVNRAFEQQSGMSNVVGRTVREVMPTIEPFWIELYARVARSGESAMFERQARSTGKWFSVKAARFVSSPEPQVGVLFRDITARKREEALRHESEERLLIALEAADLGVWEFDPRTETASTRSLRHDQMFGYSEAQPEWNLEIALRHILQEDHQTLKEAMVEAVDTGKLSVEVRVRWSDGSIHWIGCTGSTYYDEHGSPIRMAGVIADITARKAAEHSLRDSEMLFRTMADTVPIIVWTTDAEGRAEFLNRQWTLYTGQPHVATTAAQIAADHVHPDDVAITMQRFNEACRTGRQFAVEHRIRSVSGDYQWFQVQAEPYRDPQTGQILRWFGTSVDIHERKEADRQLRETAQSQAFQLELSEAIRTLDTPDEIIDVTSEMLGRRLQAARVIYCEVTGPDSLLVIRDWTADTCGGLAGETLKMSDFGGPHIADLREGRTVVNHDVTEDPRTAAQAGSFIARGVRAELAVPIMRAGRLKLVVAIHKSQPHRWQDGETQLSSAVAQQILLAAEAAAAKGALRAERDLSRAIFDSMEEGFALLSPDWVIQDINEIGARLVSQSRPEMIGRNHWEAIPEAVGSPLEPLYQRVLATGVHETFEYLHAPRTGEPHWLEIRPYRLATGGLVVFFRDISERKRIEQELNDAVRRRDEFLAMLAHELRNPLAPIRAAADVLSMPSIDETRIRETSGVISRQVKHMTGLVDDLLDVSRVTRGLTVLDKERVNLKSAASSAIEQVRPLIEARRHHLTVQSPPGDAEVFGDPKRLVQVLTNLLNNAAKYTPEGGRIALTIDIDDTHVSVTVADDGIGMSSDMLDRAFTLFSQAEQTSDRSQGGLGIGLALVKSLVELHGGTVAAASVGPGAGSEFTVRLPRPPGAPAPTRTRDNAALPSPGQPLRVLIVDDNEDAASMLQLFLEASGHTVTIEHGSRTGLERALAERPDVCLLDIGLPDMDGNELARRLRASEQTRDAVLIAITGYGQESDRKSTAAAGFDHHLVKPIDPFVLAGLLAAVRR
ncbi:PAS domain S-box protein [Cognatilysobacter bugurensis]|uniref:histidine kinase n=1 Tax=Cognatilysobacter bugurensis TaxID=543356 RepID=A0A918T0M6_9GAMM|nr:PAS domain S-box protein [Lysobacter bugurensis]GHA80383.1 hypothetical protein GCM10007067_17670 [Lysobacter bugurensis]